MDLLIPVILLGSMGAIFAFLLGVVSKLTAIEVHPRQEALRDALPGANCGACGYPGCDACAKALNNGEVGPDICPIGGQKVADQLAEILGMAHVETSRQVACVMCQGDCDHAKEIYQYDGIKDCRVMSMEFGGLLACNHGCVGCGSCKDVCEYGAIEVENGLARIIPENCVACKKCVAICPKNIIKMVPYEQKQHVKCMNPNFGKDVRNACSIGCIGCGLCAKLEPEYFEMNGKLAHAIYDENADRERLEAVAAKCPAKCITVQ